MKHQRATMADIYQLRRRTSYTHELIRPALISSPNGMGICFTSVSTAWWGEACCLFMMTSSNGNIFRVTGHLCGEFTVPAQRPVTRGFDVFFDLRPDKRLSKQSRVGWFETPSHSLWRHRNVLCFPMGICVLCCTECRSEFWLFRGLFTFYVRFTNPNVADNRNR